MLIYHLYKIIRNDNLRGFNNFVDKYVDIIYAFIFVQFNN